MKVFRFTLIGLFCLLSYVQAFSQKKYENGFDTTYYTAIGISGAIDYRSPEVMNVANSIKDKYPGSLSIDQISETFQYFFRNWKYIPDPGYEYFEKASSVVTSLDGDCDDYAIGMVAVIKALGGEGRIVAVTGHAYPEVLIGKNLSESDLDEIIIKLNDYHMINYGYSPIHNNLNYHVDNDGTYWLNLDYQVDYPGGYFHENSLDAAHVVINIDGTYRSSYLNREKEDFLSQRVAASGSN